MLNVVFMKYLGRYQASNILCIIEGQYYARHSNEDNVFLKPSSWAFDCSYERDNIINTMLS